MRNYDIEREARVWQRVMGGMPPAIPADAVAALCHSLRDAANNYASLTRRLPRARHVLRRMATAASQDADRLGAIFYVLTGDRVPREKPKPPRSGDLRETLRQQYREERRIARDAEAYAQRGGEFAEELREIAAGANDRARLALRLF